MADKLASSCRKHFDGAPCWLSPSAIVAFFALCAALTGWLQWRALHDGCATPPDLVRLEVAFTAPKFRAALKSADVVVNPIRAAMDTMPTADSEPVQTEPSGQPPDACARNAAASLIGWDMPFALTYALALSALFLWAERWRRRTLAGKPRSDASASRWRNYFVVAPLFAGLLDVFENIALWFAASSILNRADGELPQRVHVFVLIGSLAALGKWLLLLLSAAGILIETFSGPRGRLLARLRYSALGVALAGLPVLATSQGQDVLQRLLEGDSQLPRAIWAALAVTFAAATIWYCARKLAEIQFPEVDSEGATPDRGEWYTFFGDNIPRLLGIAMLVLAALAFATAGLALPRILGVAIGAGATAHLLGRTQLVEMLGRGLTLGKLRDLSTLEERQERGSTGAKSRTPSLEQLIGRLVVAVALTALAVWPSGGDAGAFPAHDQTAHHLRIAAYLCLCMAWVFHLFVYHRRRIAVAQRRQGWSEAAVDVTPLESPDWALRWKAIAGALLSAVILGVFASWPVEFGRRVGALWVLSLVTANAVFFGSLSVWIGRRWGVPVFRAAVAIALLFSLWNDNHAVRLLGSGTRAHLRPSFSQRLSTLRRPADQRPMVLVAASGGGLRAAYWTAIALATIQDRAPAFVPHVFAISGVSGGSLGATLFTALARDRAEQLPCAVADQNDPQASKSFSFTRCTHRFMRDDFLSPVLGKFLAPDLAQWFLPFGVPLFDRGRALEQSWEESYAAATRRPTFSQGFTNLTPDAGAPALILNSTHVQSGRRYIASVLDPASVLIDAVDVVAALGDEMPLSTAVHNSARFPYISPAGRLRTEEGLEIGHVVDGGYFENSGLATLREVRDFLRDAHEPDPWVLYLCNDPIACAAEDEPTGLDRVAGTAGDEWLSPIRALLHTRDARASLARASIRQLNLENFLQLNVCAEAPARAGTQWMTTAQGARAQAQIVSPPLGWSLSKLSRDWMDASLAGSASDPKCYRANAAVLARLSEVFAQ